jgi:hypothetical protein
VAGVVTGGGVGGKESVEGEPWWVNGEESEDVNGS